MTRHKRSNRPQKVTPEVWYYELPRGLDFIVECRNGDGDLLHHQFRVPIAKVRKSVANYPRPTAKGGR